MKYLKTPHEKKSAVITTLITALLIILFFLLGLKYYDPPISFGMEVNFGNASQGMGKTQPQKPVTVEKTLKPPLKKVSPKAAPKRVTQSKVATQESSDVAVHDKTKKKTNSTRKGSSQKS